MSDPVDAIGDTPPGYTSAYERPDVEVQTRTRWRSERPWSEPPTLAGANRRGAARPLAARPWRGLAWPAKQAGHHSASSAVGSV